MKILKIFIFLLISAAVGVSGWLYYPTYQIEKMKNKSLPVSTEQSFSYIDYFTSLNKSQLNHLAIGDSIISGMGSEDNESFVYQFSNELERQTDKQVFVYNEGILGVTSTELNRLVQRGEFDTQIEQADLITINVGGNDVLEAVKDTEPKEVINIYENMQTTFVENLTNTTSRIRELNPNATIVLLELYNPLKQKNELYTLANQLLPKWNVNIYEVAEKLDMAIVVETTKVINSEHLQYLSSDGVHPNAMGYEAISKQILNQLKKKPYARSA
ncbi:lysophospholipase L1-like esterase [Bacillus ectoiniformans]|uniref:GDSL-type esterase/lipase family protein n=1 Tax=Bacillus ectoiniformans TaxID=1494429 RepID=UPI00195DB880|nr:GDSL-type esterase/lipase family protein [Bacillus ectoiniformans]MBM7649187.1 lysophospholipase L1-like esterase [Bacillus ectoiniformans]